MPPPPLRSPRDRVRRSEVRRRPRRRRRRLRTVAVGGGLERTTSYYHLDREAAVRRDEERRFARRCTLAPGELRLPRDLYERRGIASSDEEEEALREKMVKGAVVLGA